jgi:alpha-glucosidase
MAITADKQEGDPGSTLNFYRAALTQRRLLSGSLEWLDAPEGVLHFRRGRHHVMVNISGQGVPITGTPLLASGSVEGGVLPPDTAIWTTE